MDVEQTIRFCKRCGRETEAYRSPLGGWHCGTCGRRHSAAGITLLFVIILVATAGLMIYFNPEWRQQFNDLISRRGK
jgi:ribosomal protein L37AE/L43A